MIGFVILILGTAIYNNLMPVPCLDKPRATHVSVDPDESDEAPLLYDIQKNSYTDEKATDA